MELAPGLAQLLAQEYYNNNEYINNNNNSVHWIIEELPNLCLPQKSYFWRSYRLETAHPDQLNMAL